MQYEIKQLIPQREPFLLVDELVCADESSCTTSFIVKDGVVPVFNGILSEAGVIEHMAQSASALAGYHFVLSGAQQPPLGMIGEIKSFTISNLPKTGDSLETHISFGLSVGNITVATAQTFINGIVVATAQFKISVD